MVELTLSGLNRQSIYEQSLNQIEKICDEYKLENHFGSISMANQEVIDFLKSNFESFLIDVNFCIDNTELSIFYTSQDNLFSGIKFYMQQHSILGCLADEVQVDSENKSLTITFHVKPLIQIGRRVRNSVSQTTKLFMKNTFVLLFLLCIGLTSFADQYKVLFIGNSYTDVNNLPSLVKQVCNSVGDEITYSASMPGGCTFQNHLTQSMSYIKQGGWDYVVLQEQSQLPSFPINQFMNESYPYAQQLCDSIRKYNPSAEIVFYMTWGRKYGDQQNALYYPPLGTYEGMDSLLYARYMMMAEDNEAVVSPVGALWHYIRDNYPDIELYQSDNSHPSLAGSYAAACSFFTIFTHKTPVLITDNCGVSDSIAAIIRASAETVVYDSLDKWLFLNPIDTSEDDTLDVNIYQQSTIQIYPNPVSDYLFINTELDIHDCSILLYNQKGILVKRLEGLNNEQFKYNVSNLVSGIYFVQIRRGEKVLSTNKIMKR